MSFSSMKNRLQALWLKFNLTWARASEIQEQVDKARRESHYQYRNQWKI